MANQSIVKWELPTEEHAREATRSAGSQDNLKLEPRKEPYLLRLVPQPKGRAIFIGFEQAFCKEGDELLVLNRVNGTHSYLDELLEQYAKSRDPMERQRADKSEFGKNWCWSQGYRILVVDRENEDLGAQVLQASRTVFLAITAFLSPAQIKKFGHPADPVRGFDMEIFVNKKGNKTTSTVNRELNKPLVWTPKGDYDERKCKPDMVAIEEVINAAPDVTRGLVFRTYDQEKEAFIAKFGGGGEDLDRGRGPRFGGSVSGHIEGQIVPEEVADPDADGDADESLNV